jgi:adenylosuccinate synthase
MVNGTDEMALTKLDWVPRYGKEVLICVAYKRKGKRLKIAPDAAYKLEESKPIYISLPTWQENIQNVRKFKDLPKNAQNYVVFLEKQTGIPITRIGVGPRRDQVINR